jgi:hypothetical protein
VKCEWDINYASMMYNILGAFTKLKKHIFQTGSGLLSNG